VELVNTKRPQESLLNVDTILNLLYCEINHGIHDIQLFFELKVLICSKEWTN